MANTRLVLLVLLIFSAPTWALDRFTAEGFLGEKSLGPYYGTHQPLIFQNPTSGSLKFQDENILNNFFNPYLFTEENSFATFLNDELAGGMNCPNETFNKYYDEMRFSYRLITLSYLIEGQWHMQTAGEHLGVKPGCGFNLENWTKSCRPKSTEMKNFISRLQSFAPKYVGPLERTYDLSSWINDTQKSKFKYYSQYRMLETCKNGCNREEVGVGFTQACSSDQALMTTICSEEDELYGLSAYRDAYYLIGQSNIINTFNKGSDALGCLRRFSEVMSHREVRYPNLKNLFPPIQSYLRQEFQERYIQGRVFFYGSSKEFEQKGVKNIFVKDQTIEAIVKTDDASAPTKTPVPVNSPPTVAVVKEVKTSAPVEPPRIVEIKKAMKSAFLQAAELRQSENLDQVRVDMMKLKYDYVFTLNMINNLSEKLKTFMTREALKEMMSFDKLGTKEGPVPLLFIKFMIDMEEHQGLFNLTSILGERFFVTNEIDASFKPKIELIRLSNQEMGGNWQITILRP
jgi:hypothetical protein